MDFVCLIAIMVNFTAMLQAAHKERHTHGDYAWCLPFAHTYVHPKIVSVWQLGPHHTSLYLRIWEPADLATFPVPSWADCLPPALALHFYVQFHVHFHIIWFFRSINHDLTQELDPQHAH